MADASFKLLKIWKRFQILKSETNKLNYEKSVQSGKFLQKTSGTNWQNMR